MYDPGQKLQATEVTAPTYGSGAPPSPAPLKSPKRAGQPVDLQRLWRAVRAGGRWIGISVVAAAAVGFVVAQFLMPRTYQASSSFVYEGLPEVEGLPAPALEMRELRTLVDSVKLPTNVKAVKEKLGLPGSLESIAQNIDVTYDLESNLVTVAARADEPAQAAALADATVEVFLGHRRGVEGERLGEYAETVAKDLKLAKEELSEAQERYDAFRKRHGVSDLSSQRQEAIQGAAELQAAADMARAEAEAETARVSELQSAAKGQSATTVISSSSPTARALSEKRSELAAAQSRLSDAHPRVQALKMQVQALEKQVKTGSNAADQVHGLNPQYQQIQGSLTGASAQREASARRESEFRALAEKADGRIQELSRLEGQASRLLAAVQVGETHVNELQERVAKAKEAARSPTAGFRVIAPVVEPTEPQGSVARYAVAGGLPLGALLLSVLFFLGRELRGLRVRTPAEVAYWGNGPVVGTSAWPRDPEALGKLIHEMDDFVPDAAGRTLVVGATEGDRELAEDLAANLSTAWEPTTLIGQDVRQAEAERQERSAKVVHLPKQSAPVTGSAPQATRTSRGAMVEVPMESPAQLLAEPWEGSGSGPELRRAARLADRVLVVVFSGAMTGPEIAQIPTRLGRDKGIGYVVVGLDSEAELGVLPDRVGDVGGFWSHYR